MSVDCGVEVFAIRRMKEATAAGRHHSTEQERKKTIFHKLPPEGDFLPACRSPIDPAIAAVWHGHRRPSGLTWTLAWPVL